MKTQTKVKFTFIAFVAAILFAFTTPPVTVKFKVDPKASTLVWIGKKVTGQHTGNVPVASGELTTDGKLIKEGSFEIDLANLTVTDVTDAESNGKLVGHLKSDDFFSTEKNPKAKFVISSVALKSGDDYTVKGKLTIKGITNDIEFPAVIKNDGKKITATAKIIVDRTKFDIKYRSTNFFENLGDKAISNEFELDVKLSATVQTGA